MEQSITTAGIDTSKAKLDTAIHGDTRTWQVDNDPRGWHEIARLYAERGITRVGIEASGGYERGVVATKFPMNTGL